MAATCILGKFGVDQRIQQCYKVAIFLKANMQFLKFVCKTPNYGPILSAVIKLNLVIFFLLENQKPKLE
jgi:hypothetical protein